MEIQLPVSLNKDGIVLPNSDEEYSQCDCYENKVKERLRDELKCLRPVQGYLYSKL